MKKLASWMPPAGLLLALAWPAATMALDEDECSNNAVPRSTPSSDFTVIGDGSIVRHESTGLVWQRCAVGQSWGGSNCTGTATTRTWQGALEVAADAGGNWRLPNINELRSIVEECRFSPAINRVVFPDTVSNARFWSASPYVGAATQSWAVAFFDGSNARVFKPTEIQVRLVRGGP